MPALRLITATILLLLLFAACDTAPKEPKAVVAEFDRAMRAEDLKALRRVVSTPAKEAIDALPAEAEFTADPTRGPITIGEPQIDGDRAVVLIEGEGLDEDGLVLKKEGSAWRVAAILDEEQEVSLEFFFGMLTAFSETVVQTADTWMNDEQTKDAAAFEALASFSTEQYQESWTNNVDLQGKTALDAISLLAESIGLVVEPMEFASRLEYEVPAALSGVTKLAAIEALAGHADLHPVFPGQRDGEVGSRTGAPARSIEVPKQERFPDNRLAITFREGKRLLPAAYNGPFVLDVMHLYEYVPYATGELELRWLAIGLPEPVRAAARVLDLSGEATLHHLEQEEGISLDYGAMLDEELQVAVLERTGRFFLPGLTRDVHTIQGLVSELRVPVPTGVVPFELTLSPDQLNRSQSSEGISAVLLEIEEKNIRLSMRFMAPPAEEPRVEALLRAADGAPIRSYANLNQGRSDKEYRLSVQVLEDGVPETLQLKVVTDLALVTHPMSLENIPLSRHQEMPEIAPTVDFGGKDSPVDFEILSVESGEKTTVIVRAVNNANLDILQINWWLRYTEEGNDDSNHMSEWNYPAIEAGGATRLTQTLEVPVNDQSKLSAEIASVMFEDGSEWKPEQ